MVNRAYDTAVADIPSHIIVRINYYNKCITQLSKINLFDGQHRKHRKWNNMVASIRIMVTPRGGWAVAKILRDHSYNL